MPYIDGSLLLGNSSVKREETFRTYNPATGSALDPAISSASALDVEQACVLAAGAADSYRNLRLEVRAHFLETIAERITALGEALIERGTAETGLPTARLEAERARTVGQIRMFAEVVRSRNWLGLRHDAAQPERKPFPRPELFLRHIPVGPVAVFGASNFPLAFSVAGGDTVSAFAAGCPVVVKGHPAHAGTGELVGRAIQEAVAACDLPEGVFSLLQGESNELGALLVIDPRIQAVGFTGSRTGGLALVALASSRPQPIPVFAEMSSINPVILLPEALRKNMEAIAAGFVGSLTLGAGQFCTNPGLVLAIEGPDLNAFETAVAAKLRETAATPMLSVRIRENYVRGVSLLESSPDAELIGRGATSDKRFKPRAALFRTSADAMMRAPELGHEVFGSSAVIVRCSTEDELVRVLESLEGQLTATIHLTESDEAIAKSLLPVLERKAGRVIANAWPTGVEVVDAMVHGGPYPATSDGRFTSVGSLAINRFLRPVCYQGLPTFLLPSDFHTS